MVCLLHAELLILDESQLDFKLPARPASAAVGHRTTKMPNCTSPVSMHKIANQNTDTIPSVVASRVCSGRVSCTCHPHFHPKTVSSSFIHKQFLPMTVLSNFVSRLVGTQKGGGPKGGSPEGWGTERWAPKGWDESGFGMTVRCVCLCGCVWVCPPKGGGPKLSRSFPSPTNIRSCFLSRGVLVELWLRVTTMDNRICTFGSGVFVRAPAPSQNSPNAQFGWSMAVTRGHNSTGTPRERKQERILVGEGKESEILGGSVRGSRRGGCPGEGGPGEEVVRFGRNLGKKRFGMKPFWMKPFWDESVVG